MVPATTDAGPVAVPPTTVPTVAATTPPTVAADAAVITGTSGTCRSSGYHDRDRLSVKRHGQQQWYLEVRQAPQKNRNSRLEEDYAPPPSMLVRCSALAFVVLRSLRKSQGSPSVLLLRLPE